MLLYANVCSILDGDLVALCYAVRSMECKGSYGTILFDHLAADGASLTGGQVAVVAVGQVDANLLSCLHLELVHCLTSLGNIDLIVVLHNDTPLSVLTESSAATIALPNLRRKHIDFFGKIALGACGWLPGSLEVRIWKNGDR